MKVKLRVLFFVVIVFMLVGCNNINDPPISDEQVSTIQASTSSEQADAVQVLTTSEPIHAARPMADYSTLENSESAYTAFLSNLFSGDEDPKNLYNKKDWNSFGKDIWNDMSFYFALKDLDNDGVMELIIKNNLVNVAVYTFNNGLIKAGSCNFGTGTTRLLFSDKPAYPGVFFFFASSGLMHYGYMSVKDNQLIYEELWNEDFSGSADEMGIERDRIEELSDDKALIKESKIVYDNNNDIEWESMKSLEVVQ